MHDAPAFGTPRRRKSGRSSFFAVSPPPSPPSGFPKRHTQLLDTGGDTAGPSDHSELVTLELETPAQAEAGSSIASCIANLANTNLGVGMLALPAALASAGVVGGVGLLLLSAAIASFGSHLFAECVNAVGRPATMSKVTAAAMAKMPGPVGCFGTLVTDFAVAVIGSSSAIGYLIVVGDTLPEIKAWVVGHSNTIFDSREFWICAVLPIIVPLAYLRHIDSLRFASFCVIGCVVVIVVTVVLFALQPTPLFDPCGGAGERARGGGEGAGSGEEAELQGGGSSCRGPISATSDALHTLTALPTFLFAFAAQINVPSIASELRRPTPHRIAAVMLGGVGLTTAVYLMVGGGGYATYGSLVSEDLFLSYPSSAIAARVSLIYVVVLSHPVVSYSVAPCIANALCTLSSVVRQPRNRAVAPAVSSRLSAAASLSNARRQKARNAPIYDLGLDALAHVPEEMAAGPFTPRVAVVSPRPGAAQAGSKDGVFVTDRTHAAIIGFYLLLTTTTALLVHDLGIVIALAGAVSATIAVFIAPGACYWCLHPDEGLSRTRLLAGLLFVSGCILMPLLVVSVLASRGLIHFGEAGRT